MKAIQEQSVVNTDSPLPVQFIPSGEVAIVFVPVPDACHILPFHDILYPPVENIVFPKADHI